LPQSLKGAKNTPTFASKPLCLPSEVLTQAGLGAFVAKFWSVFDEKKIHATKPLRYPVLC
jgi:hypothetical protein